MSKKISDEDKKLLKHFENELKKLEKRADDMLNPKPTKEDIKLDQEIRQLEKEIAGTSKFCKTALMKNAQQKKEVEKILKHDPKNKNAHKALQSLKKNRANLEKLQSDY